MKPLLGKHLINRQTLGIMSGTSLDGVDLSLARFKRNYGIAECHNFYAKFPSPLRKELFDIASSKAVSKERLLRADKRLGRFYLKSARALLRSLGAKAASLDLVGSHGQTVCHSAEGSGQAAANNVTLQIGSPDIIAQGLGVPVVSDFRTADVAAGGRGAPLAPLAHFYLFNVRRTGQLVINIGGISNMTYLPGTADVSGIVATDCGPGNMLVDQLCLRLFGKPYDRDGRIASDGSVSEKLHRFLKQMGFLSRRTPLALGREQFGDDVVDSIIRHADRAGVDRNSVISTVTRFTAYCIARAARRCRKIDRVLLCGGGAHNIYLCHSLQEMFPGVKIHDSSVAGIDPDFVESVAFALLANLAVDGKPGNLPQVTGAAKRVTLGKMTFA
jgi:anhydro-N-acetylmuramic acid kinase